MSRQLDLGSANALRHNQTFDEIYGVDVVQSEDPRIKLCDLNIEPLPFEDDFFELVTAYDILEHISPILYLPIQDYLDHAPKTKHKVEVIYPEASSAPAYLQTAYNPKALVKRYCVIELFNEIYRVLKPNGTFYMQTPINDFSDPTHVAHWTIDTLNHFSGDYFGFHNHYGHTSRFEKEEAHEENGHIYATLKAVKNLPPDAEYKIHY